MPDLHPTAPPAPIDLGACVRRRFDRAALPAELAAALPEGLRVYGALDLAAARPKLQVPCVVVLPLEDRPEAPMSPDPDVKVVQRVTTTVGVVTGVACPNDLGGLKDVAADALSALLEPVRDALLGWSPAGRFPTDPPPAEEGGIVPAATWPLLTGRWTPLVWVRGRLLRLAEGRAWWQDEYSTTWIARSRPHAEEAGPFAAVRGICAAVAVPAGSEPAAPVEVGP